MMNIENADNLMNELLNGNYGESENYPVPQGDVLNISIEVDDILAAFGATLVFRDITTQLGGLGNFYEKVVHPTISELYNGLIDIQPHLMDNIYQNQDICNFIHDALESKAYLLVDGLRDNVNVEVTSKEIVQLGTVMINILLNHFRLILQDRVPLAGEGHPTNTINIYERCRTAVLPSEKDPHLLNINIDYFVVFS